MNLRLFRTINFFAAVFLISGFAGLIYESIWTHYIKLFLGHAAYAQTLVLVIFMGGMSAGAWLVGRFTFRIKNLLVVYALVELALGIGAVSFHWMFTSVTEFTYSHAFPLLESYWSIVLTKWGIASLMILPQSILLGATFPLMSSGVIRIHPLSAGRSLSALYFGNSLGAAVGVLCSGFVFIRLFGLPGTILLAGTINILLACFVWLLGRRIPCEPVKSLVHEKTDGAYKRSGIVTSLLLVAAFTGMASFLYEIAWIRLLSLVLGASTHAFELMLSSFIFGLAIGGFIIRKKIDHLKDLLKTLAYIQLLMGTLAVLTIPLFGEQIKLMAFFIASLTPSDEGYMLFNMASHFIASLTMVFPTICAGMTLPLITKYLVENRSGEAAVGQVYASNTIGSIVGVIIGSQILMPLLGVKALVILGAIVDVGLGMYLIFRFVRRPAKKHYAIVFAAVSIVICSGFWAKIDYRHATSGVFRRGNVGLEVAQSSELIFHRDGRTSTVDVIKTQDGLYSLKTNGKTDASAYMSGARSVDMVTQVGLAVIPLSLHPSTKSAAVIGMGSGVTANTLLASQRIETVDIIEIEAAMVDAAKHFKKHSQNVFLDKRSHIHIEDAKAYFTAAQKKYDIIISEPSNPWVSGVSGLFSVEFYKHIQRYLSGSGVLVQWFPLYEMSSDMMISVLKAFKTFFPYYQIYSTGGLDVVIIASQRELNTVPYDIFSESAELERIARNVSIGTPVDICIQKSGSNKLFDIITEMYSAPPNSDYFPYLDTHAVRARFRKTSALELFDNATSTLPLSRDLFNEHWTQLENPDLDHNFPVRTNYSNAFKLYHAILDKSEDEVIPSDFLVRLLVWNLVHGDGSVKQLRESWEPLYLTLTKELFPYLSRAELAKFVWTIIRAKRFGDLRESTQSLVRLHYATFKRDSARMVELAMGVLNSSEKISIEVQQQVVERLCLAYIHQGKYRLAAKALNRRNRAAPPSMTSRILATYVAKKQLKRK